MTNSTANQQFIDLEIHIFPRQNAGYPVAITLNSQQEFPRGYLSTSVLPWTSSGDSVVDGQRLFETLFADVALRSAWNRARGQSEYRRIRLHINTDAPELHALPWELLRESATMLSANASTPFSRYLPVPESWGDVVKGRPIRALAVLSNPKDLESKYSLPPINVAVEQGILKQAFSPLGRQVSLDFLDPPVTLEHIEEAFQQSAGPGAPGYHILHYVGHGAFGERRHQAKAVLYLEDNGGNTDQVSDTAFSAMLNRQSPQARPRLVFLTTCQSATRLTTDALVGFAPKLVTAGVPAVVAMQENVAIETARKLSQVFYRRLAEHGVVDYALNQARSQLLTAEHPDATVPVLFMRLKSGQLWKPAAKQPAHIFLCYKRHTDSDQKLAAYLHETLKAQGHEVFIDETIRTGTTWLREIDEQIKISDFLIVLLSQESADSEMVQAEVSRAYEYRREQGKPLTLPVRIAYEGLLPYSIAFYLSPLQYVVWQSEADNEHVAREILQAIQGQLPDKTPVPIRPTTEPVTVSEDGRIVRDIQAPPAPLPEFDQHILESLVAPGGTVRMRDKFYVEREADIELRHEIVEPGAMVTIRASRQTGKSSLLVRGMHHASQQGAQVVVLDLQRLDEDYLASPDRFLRNLAEFIVRRLRLNISEVERAWQSSMGPQDKLTCLMEDYVLPEADTPIVLAMDEADRLLETPFHSNFFALMRAWFNSAAYDEMWEKLAVVLIISTEPYLLIQDLSQSPFNVGAKLYLKDFDETQVRDLNQRHGEPVAEHDLPQLMDFFGGHPYLTRKALYTLVTKRWSWQQLIEAAPTDQGPFSDHLRRYHWLLRDEPSLWAALRQVIREQSCADDMVFFRLLRAGLVKGSGAVCRYRCGLYRTYFEDKFDDR